MAQLESNFGGIRGSNFRGAFESNINRIVDAMKSRETARAGIEAMRAAGRAVGSSALFGLGGVGAGQLSEIQRGRSDALLDALRQASMFGAQQFAGEAKAETGFMRQQELERQKFEQQKELLNIQMAAKAAQARDAQKSALFGQAIGGLGAIGGAVLGAKLSPLNALLAAGGGGLGSPELASPGGSLNLASRAVLPGGFNSLLSIPSAIPFK